LKREIIKTGDGSATILLPEWNESYHSRHGAITEAYHVFIKNGLSMFDGRPVSVMEIGLGTGLNAFITFLESEKTGQKINYTGIEGYPVSVEEAAHLNYPELLNAENYSHVFKTLHNCAWGNQIELSEKFTFSKLNIFFADIKFESEYDLIFFDAFGFNVQPELWSGEIFTIMYNALRPKGVLVTYAARSIIKRNMQTAGFTVEKLAGPPGKREMMRAIKS
jgi:tRNA U34 5-methylaminomethyl-2-thiouridine-forming methyltransferase MnmC